MALKLCVLLLAVVSSQVLGRESSDEREWAENNKELEKPKNELPLFMRLTTPNVPTTTEVPEKVVEKTIPTIGDKVVTEVQQEHLLTSAVELPEETKISPEQFDEKIGELPATFSHGDKLKKISEASERIADFIKNEFAGLLGLMDSSKRVRRDINEKDMEKFIYITEKNKDKVPHMETNEVEILLKAAEHSGKDDKNKFAKFDTAPPTIESLEKINKDTLNNFDSTQSEMASNAKDFNTETIQDEYYNQTPQFFIVASEPEGFSQEFSDDVESEIVEKVGEPRITHISRSSRYRLSRIPVPHYINTTPFFNRY